MVYSHDTGSYDCSGDEGAGATCRYLLLNTASGWEVVHVVETPEEGGTLAASLVLVRPEKARSLEPPRGGWSFTVQGKYGLQRYNDSTIEVAPLESGSIESANHPLPSCLSLPPCDVLYSPQTASGPTGRWRRSAASSAGAATQPSPGGSSPATTVTPARTR